MLFMNKWDSLSWSSTITIVIATLFIYLAVIAYTRIFGKRSLSKMSSFDFAMTIAVGSIIATTILSKNVAIIEGALALFMLYFFQFIIALMRKIKPLKKIIDNEPLLLMEDGRILEKNLKKVRLTEDDLRSKLRESNVMNLTEVKAVVFETKGDIIVIHTADDSRKLSPWMLKDVKRE